MISVTIYHKKEWVGTHVMCKTSAEEISEMFENDEYKEVAAVECDTNNEKLALSQSFQRTNHIEEAWYDNEDVTKLTTEDERSTSVGDIMVINDDEDQKYVVARFGFTKI